MIRGKWDWQMTNQLIATRLWLQLNVNNYYEKAIISALIIQTNLCSIAYMHQISMTYLKLA